MKKVIKVGLWVFLWIVIVFGVIIFINNKYLTGNAIFAGTINPPNYSYHNYTAELGENYIDNINYSFSELSDPFNKSIGLHFNHMPITFTINATSCGDFRTKRIEWAFQVVQDKTKGMLTFKEVPNSEDINVRCWRGNSPNASIDEKSIDDGYYYLFLGTNITTNSTLNFYNVKIEEEDQLEDRHMCEAVPINEVSGILNVLNFDYERDEHGIYKESGFYTNPLRTSQNGYCPNNINDPTFFDDDILNQTAKLYPR